KGQGAVLVRDKEKLPAAGVVNRDRIPAVQPGGKGSALIPIKPEDLLGPHGLLSGTVGVDLPVKDHGDSRGRVLHESLVTARRTAAGPRERRRSIENPSRKLLLRIAKALAQRGDEVFRKGRSRKRQDTRDAWHESFRTPYPSSREAEDFAEPG